MRLRDRRGPFTALVIGAGYLLMLIWPILLVAELAGAYQPSALHGFLRWLLGFNAVMLLWRLAFRFAFTTREYGRREGAAWHSSHPCCQCHRDDGRTACCDCLFAHIARGRSAMG